MPEEIIILYFVHNLCRDPDLKVRNASTNYSRVSCVQGIPWMVEATSASYWCHLWGDFSGNKESKRTRSMSRYPYNHILGKLIDQECLWWSSVRKYTANWTSFVRSHYHFHWEKLNHLWITTMVECKHVKTYRQSVVLHIQGTRPSCGWGAGQSQRMRLSPNSSCAVIRYQQFYGYLEGQINQVQENRLFACHLHCHTVIRWAINCEMRFVSSAYHLYCLVSRWRMALKRTAYSGFRR